MRPFGEGADVGEAIAGTGGGACTDSESAGWHKQSATYTSATVLDEPSISGNRVLSPYL